jgi:aryl-alcohol dehydrogenase-like predicted oxidoreductase
VLDAYMEAGGNFIDTADVYSRWAPGNKGGESEVALGIWMAARKNRHAVIMATKVCGPMGSGPNDGGLSRLHIMQAVEASLTRLKTDYVDLYQAHWDDKDTPLDETLRAFDDLVRAGKVRYIGTSNFVTWKIARAMGRSEVLGVARFDSAQPRYTLLFRQIERDLLPMCREEGVGVIPYNPLAGGLLSGKHRKDGGPTAGTRFTLANAARRYQDRYWHDREFATVEALRPLAAEAGLSLARMAVGWVLAHPAVTAPIIGASRPEQLDDVLPVAEKGIDAELKERLDALTAEYRLGDDTR